MEYEKRNKQGQTLEGFLAEYNPGKYDRPSVTVDMVVFTIHNKALSVVLVQRSDHPNIGKWALPGGFINMEETLVQSAARELQEETGLVGVALHPIGCFGEPSRDPRTRVVTSAFAAFAPNRCLKIAAGDDAADARLFSVAIEKREAILLEPQTVMKNEISLPCTACGEAYDASAGEEYALILRNGDQTLTARVALAPSLDGLSDTPVLLPSCAQLPDGELSGDHALILFSALRYLAQKNTVKAAQRMEAEPYVLECAVAVLR